MSILVTLKCAAGGLRDVQRGGIQDAIGESDVRMLKLSSWSMWSCLMLSVANIAISGDSLIW